VSALILSAISRSSSVISVPSGSIWLVTIVVTISVTISGTVVRTITSIVSSSIERSDSVSRVVMPGVDLPVVSAIAVFVGWFVCRVSSISTRI